jgi:hypothetical protein
MKDAMLCSELVAAFFNCRATFGMCRVAFEFPSWGAKWVIGKLDDELGVWFRSNPLYLGLRVNADRILLIDSGSPA